MKTTKNTIRQAYFDWMCDSIDMNDPPVDKSYWNMLNILNIHEFTYPRKQHMDVNRVVDAMDMRHTFLNEYFKDHYHNCVESPFKGIKPSLLEVMVALARRCETDIMYDAEMGDRTGKWFWMMIENIGWLDFDDETILNHSESTALLNNQIDILLNRKYRYSGDGGGLWPLKNPDKDQREVDIWSQMTRFLSERGEI